MNPSKLRPKRDWVLVLDDQRKTTLSSGLIIPGVETGIEKVMEWSGTIIRLGPGEKADKLNLCNGMRIMYRGFLKHANRVESEEKWEDGSPKHYFLMSIDDIVAEIGEEVEVGYFSAEKK